MTTLWSRRVFAAPKGAAPRTKVRGFHGSSLRSRIGTVRSRTLLLSSKNGGRLRFVDALKRAPTNSCDEPPSGWGAAVLRPYEANLAAFDFERVYELEG